MGSWNVIAKNEIKTKTSKFRQHRVLYFVILYGVILTWAFIVAPMLFDSFMPTLDQSETLNSIIFPAVALIIQFLLMIVFIMLLIYPANFIYRGIELGNKEIILATPVTAGDIFFGEFMGKVPFILLYALGLTPAIVGLINPLIHLNFLQTLVIYVDIICMVLFALLLGNILASWFEHKIVDSEKCRDYAKVLIVIFGIGILVLVYSILLLFQYLLSHPEFKNWLVFFPAIWFSNIIIYILEPSLLDSSILNIWMSIGLAVIIPLLVIYLSYKKADAFFSLEAGTEKHSMSIEEESKVYAFFRMFIGKNWQGLVIV